MLKNLSLILLLVTAINCMAHKENSLRTRQQTDLREEGYERARALFAIKENRAALKTLEKIVISDPIDTLTVDAVVFACEIYLTERNPEGALELLNSFEKRAQNRNVDKSRLARVRGSLARNKRIEASPVIHDEVAPSKEPPRREEAARREAVAPPEELGPPSRQVSQNVGVLLPLTGSFDIYGKRALTAIQLAFNASSQQISNGALILRNAEGQQAIVIDTKGDAQLAKAAVDRLVDEFQVAVIVGDILAESAAAVSKQAQARDVVNLTLSRREGLTSLGTHVFRLAVTATNQAKELLSAQESNTEKKRYAILYPDNPFGLEMRDAFLSQAKALGLSVVKVQSYNPNETTFTEPIRQLVGPKRTAGNLMFSECSDRANRLKDVAARKKAERDCFDAIVPSVNFDALFIPEFPKTLTYIVPALIAEGVMVSQNDDMVRAWRRTSRMSSAMPVQLLGPSSWNNELVGTKLGNQIEGALFVDSGDLSDQRELVKNFTEKFLAASQSAPTLSDAFAYDAMRVARHILNPGEKEPVLTPEGIVNKLQSLVLEGVIGKIAFDTNRELIKPFRLFSFQEGKITPRS